MLARLPCGVTWRSGYAAADVARHVSHDDLPAFPVFMPAIVDAQATRRVAAVAAALDVPVGLDPLSLPVEVERITAAALVPETGTGPWMPSPDPSSRDRR